MKGQARNLLNFELFLVHIKGNLRELILQVWIGPSCASNSQPTVLYRTDLLWPPFLVLRHQGSLPEPVAAASLGQAAGAAWDVSSVIGQHRTKARCLKRRDASKLNVDWIPKACSTCRCCKFCCFYKISWGNLCLWKIHEYSRLWIVDLIRSATHVGRSQNLEEMWRTFWMFGDGQLMPTWGWIGRIW